MSREARTGRPGLHRTSGRGAGVVRVEVEGAHGRAGSREERDTCLNPWNISPKWTKAQEGSRTLPRSPVRAEAGLSEQNGQITGNFNSQTWDWSGLRVKKHLRTAPTFMKSEG